jgi:hypothetical protein
MTQRHPLRNKRNGHYRVKRVTFTSQRVTSSPERVTSTPEKGDIDASYIGRIGKEPVKESVIGDLVLTNEPNKLSPSKAAAKAATATLMSALMRNLPVWVDREAWDAYLEMRAALKKPMTLARTTGSSPSFIASRRRG